MSTPQPSSPPEGKIQIASWAVDKIFGRSRMLILVCSFFLFFMFIMCMLSDAAARFFLDDLSARCPPKVQTESRCRRRKMSMRHLTLMLPLAAALQLGGRGWTAPRVRAVASAPAAEAVH